MSWEQGVGIALALLSGTFIGASVVFTKKALLDMKSKGHDVAQGSHEYVKSPVWWVGMVLTALGEVANFGAYAFVPAILVTPLGAISVVISAVLSSIFLNEKLNFSGMIGCAQCLIGAVIIVLHAPSQSSTNTIPEFFHWVLQPVFIVYTIVVAALLGYLIIYLQPRYAQTSPLIYITISSLGGSYLVLATQGFGTSLVYSIRNWETDNQFRQWPMYPLLGFVVFFIVFQVHFLNKALSSFSAAIVTPIYYVFFTTATMTSTAFLFQGFPVGSTVNGVSILFGFLTIVGGVALLFQYSLKLQEIAKQAGNSVARIATVRAGSSLHGADPTERAHTTDNKTESEFDGLSTTGRDLDQVERYDGHQSTSAGTLVARLGPLPEDHITNAGGDNGPLTITAHTQESRDKRVASRELHPTTRVTISENVIRKRPSVIDGDGVDERDEVTSISHALVPGLKIIKMMPSLMGTHHVKEHRSVSLPAGTAESDSKSVLSWMRKNSAHSHDSGSEVELERPRSGVPRQANYEFPASSSVAVDFGGTTSDLKSNSAQAQKSGSKPFEPISTGWLSQNHTGFEVEEGDRPRQSHSVSQSPTQVSPETEPHREN